MRDSLPLEHPALIVSTSRSLDQSSPTSAQSIFSSPVPPPSANPNLGLHRRRGSTTTDRSPATTSPTSDLPSPITSSITSNPVTHGYTPYPLSGINGSQYPEYPSQRYHRINDQTDFALNNNNNNNEFANHVTAAGFGLNTNSLATLGSSSYADIESGAIGNQSKKISSDTDQNSKVQGISGYTDITEEGSGMNTLKSTAQDSCFPRTLNNENSQDVHNVHNVQKTPNQLAKQTRLRSLDILRGITIFIMVLVNTQGADPFTQLAHSDWFGYTLADWVFPNFIFMVGIAIAIVLSPKKLTLMTSSDLSINGESGITTSRSLKPPFWKRHYTRIKMSLKILKRSILLFAIGIFLASIELIGESAENRWLRIPGVLQRISFCYFILATTVLWSPIGSKKGGLTNNLLEIFDMPNSAPSSTSSSSSSSSSYRPSKIVQIALPLVCATLWFILTFAIQSTATEQIPDCLYPSEPQSSNSQTIFSNRMSRGQLTPQWCTAQAYFDTVLFAKKHDPNHPVFDSEGSIGSLMAVVTAWFGWMIGNGVVEQQQNQKTRLGRLSLELNARYKTIGYDDNDDDADDNDNKSSCQKRKAVSEKDMMDILDAQRRSFLLAHLGRWFMAGVCIMFSGIIIGWFLPICKGLWTPSFTLYSAGISINSLCILMYLYDVAPQPKDQSTTPSEEEDGIVNKLLSTLEAVISSCGRMSTRLLICYGRNPTLIYVLTDLVKLILEKIRVDGGQDWIQTAWSFLFFKSFITFLPPAWASLIFSTFYILLFAPMMWYLDTKGLYLRV